MLIDQEELLEELHRNEKETIKKEDISSSTKETVLVIMYWLEEIVISQKLISKPLLKVRGFIEGFILGVIDMILFYYLFK